MTPWDELKYHKAISQKTSFLFLSEDISFVTIDVNVIQIIPSQIPQKRCYQTAPWKESFNPVRWVHTTPISFSGSFFLIFSEVISFSTIAFNALPNTLLRQHKNSDIKVLPQQKHLALWDECKNHKGDSQKAFLHFLSLQIQTGEKVFEKLFSDVCIHLREINHSADWAVWHHSFCGVWEGTFGNTLRLMVQKQICCTDES